MNKFKRISVLVLSHLLVAGVIGGAVYANTQIQVAKMEKRVLETKIEALQSEVEVKSSTSQLQK